jgi:hypothetical protein
MATITLLNLRTRAKQRANMENSTFVTDSEWDSYINYAISNLRDLIISKAGNDYFASSASFTFNSSTDTYSLPADFYKALWMEILGDDGYYYKMRRFEVSERNYGRSPLNYLIPDIRYRLLGNNIIITPQLQANGRQARLWYVPTPIPLSSDSDTLEGFNGWDEDVVILAARKALVKEESDTSQLDQEILSMNLRLEAMADNRDQGEPMRIQDNEVRSWGNSWP